MPGKLNMQLTNFICNYFYKMCQYKSNFFIRLIKSLYSLNTINLNLSFNLLLFYTKKLYYITELEPELPHSQRYVVASTKFLVR